MFKYYLIKTLRNKMVLFWTLIFPLALMTVMKVAFGSIYDMENSIDPMKTVIVRKVKAHIRTVSGMLYQRSPIRIRTTIISILPRKRILQRQRIFFSTKRQR